MSSGSTAQDSTWKAKEQGEEARYARMKEQEQLAAIQARMQKEDSSASQTGGLDKNFEGGFGGQEDLEDRYATTSGEH